MKAARWHGVGDVRIEDVDVPVSEAQEALLEVLWCGICGTDLEEYRDGPITIPTTPHPTRGSSAPITLGHEVVGRVVIAAADGSGPGAGAVVVPDVVLGCGKCRWCLRHEEGLCPYLAVRGQTEDGGLAQFMVANASSLLVVPDGVEPEHAALTEPASVAVRAVHKLGVTLGKRIAVIGVGTVGQLVARVAEASGAVVELAVDTRVSRRERAVAEGARAASDPVRASELVDAAAGFDAVFECSGADGALALALALTRRGGTVIDLGIRSHPELFDATALVLSEKRLIGSAAHLWDEDAAPALDLIASGRIRVDDLISRRIPLVDVVTGGFDVLADPTSDVLKVLVDCR